MSRKLRDLEKKLNPAWLAVVNVLSVLYGVWGATHIYDSMIRGQSGAGVLGIWIVFIPIAFLGSFLLTGLPLGWALSSIKDFGLRSIIVLVALGIFFAGYGEPTIWLLATAGATFVWVYWEYKKSFEDEEELKKL